MRRLLSCVDRLIIRAGDDMTVLFTLPFRSASRDSDGDPRKESIPERKYLSFSGSLCNWDAVLRIGSRPVRHLSNTRDSRTRRD